MGAKNLSIVMRELLPNVLLQLRSLWILWLKKNSQIVPIFSVSVMEKEETKDAKAEEAEGKGQQQEQQEGFVLCFC